LVGFCVGSAWLRGVLEGRVGGGGDGKGRKKAWEATG
jgi:hypothetical protein